MSRIQETGRAGQSALHLPRSLACSNQSSEPQMQSPAQRQGRDCFVAFGLFLYYSSGRAPACPLSQRSRLRPKQGTGNIFLVIKRCPHAMRALLSLATSDSLEQKLHSYELTRA